MMKLRLAHLGLALCVGLLVACSGGSKSVRKSQGVMDTPKFHIAKGEDALAGGDVEEATSSFRKALELDKNSSSAKTGLAVAEVQLADNPRFSDHKRTAMKAEAAEMLESGLDSAETKEEKYKGHERAIRYFVYTKPESWLETARDHFESAIDIEPLGAGAYFYMGQAAAHSFELAEATELLGRVLELNRGYVNEADQELKTIQLIQRAKPGSQFGQKIAFVKHMTRADMAALFYAELRLDQLYKKSQVATPKAFAAPGAQQRMDANAGQGETPRALDLNNHPLKSTIEEILKLGVKGLEADAAHKFHPDQPVSRAEFALMLQDIMIKVTKDEALASKFVGEESPFSDVRPDAWYYNAARVTVTRGLIEVKDKVSGSFAPLDSVSGANALIAIREFKGFIQSGLR